MFFFLAHEIQFANWHLLFACFAHQCHSLRSDPSRPEKGLGLWILVAMIESDLTLVNLVQSEYMFLVFFVALLFCRLFPALQVLHLLAASLPGGDTNGLRLPAHGGGQAATAAAGPDRGLPAKAAEAAEGKGAAQPVAHPRPGTEASFLE